MGELPSRSSLLNLSSGVVQHELLACSTRRRALSLGFTSAFSLAKSCVERPAVACCSKSQPVTITRFKPIPARVHPRSVKQGLSSAGNIAALIFLSWIDPCRQRRALSKAGSSSQRKLTSFCQCGQHPSRGQKCVCHQDHQAGQNTRGQVSFVCCLWLGGCATGMNKVVEAATATGYFALRGLPGTRTPLLIHVHAGAAVQVANQDAD